MNANLRRVTFVLDVDSAEAFRYVAERIGTSQSAIMREVVSEPIQLLASALKGVSDSPDAAQLDLFRGQLVTMVNGQLEDARDLLSPAIGPSL